MVEFKNIYKTFDRLVLEDICFTLKNGSNMGISGPSGIGKSTIIDLILDLKKPTKGNITRNFNTASVVFQEDRLVDEISAFDNLYLINDDKKEIINTLKIFGIDDYNKKINEFSGGMKKRVAIARSYLYNGDILILDEAFQGLDDKNKLTASKLLNNKFIDKSIIVISHNVSDFDLFDIDENIIYL